MNHIFQRFLKSTTTSPPSNIGKALKILGFDKSLFSVTISLGTLRLFPLFHPIFLSNITSILIGTINTAVLSGYSENAVAATGSPKIQWIFRLHSTPANTTHASLKTACQAVFAYKEFFCRTCQQKNKNAADRRQQSKKQVDRQTDHSLSEWFS